MSGGHRVRKPGRAVLCAVEDFLADEAATALKAISVPRGWPMLTLSRVGELLTLRRGYDGLSLETLSVLSCQNCRCRTAQHMMDRSHCKLLYEEGEDLHEYEAFYDFSASYTEAEKQDVVRASSRMSDGSDADEEDDPVEVSRMISVNELGELVLLDGKTVGNRQWNRYYRQHLKAPDESEFAVAHRRATQLQLGALYEGESKKGSSTAGAVALHRGQRKAYGGLAGVSSRKDVRMLRAHQRAEARETLKTGVRQNKLNRTFTRVADM